MTVETPAASEPMKEISATVRVMGRNGPVAGAVPVEIALTDPAGKPSLLSGVRATENGTLVFRWTPAVNDPQGTWGLKVTELASGKGATSRIELR